MTSRAFEALIWAAPTVAVMAQIEAGIRDLGVGDCDIIYICKPLDHSWGGITYNYPPPYWVAGFAVADGPVVVEISAAREGVRFFDSVHDIWWFLLEDFGPAGAEAYGHLFLHMLCNSTNSNQIPATG